ncbi:claudin-9-like [Poecilia reticulata]|uniref:claudin-9-like n=1 Tax=Poecilia reticulata TaxID=8081 RepID=UPI0004A2260A|nr:PREDICTED: claudin-9-like [Poecilia reticulata]
MESKTVQMICVALSAVGLIAVITCCALPEWVIGHYGDLEVRVGLWMVCVRRGTGPQVCQTLESIEQISPLHSFRAVIVFSCMLGILSLLLLIFGSDFTTCVQNQDTRTKMILAAGVDLILAGLLVIILVIFETNEIRNATVRVTAGASIYIGFIAGVMMMLTGVLLCCLIRPGSSSSGGTASFSSNRV